jgi:hypothetical protein
MSYASEVLDIAESQLGVHEDPMGSNRGGCEKYQKPWGSWMIGEPWCGAFVAWVWEQAGLDGMGYANPSTATMCSIAQGDTCSPRPAAAGVNCGTHTWLLHHQVSGSVWKCIDGNASDQVKWVQRDLSGYTIYAPPEIRTGESPAPPTQTWYYIEDVHQHGVREFGGWASKSGRDKQLASMKDPGHYRKFYREYPDPDCPYYFEDPSKSERYYGGWTSKKNRDNAQDSLEEQFDRDMRPFSREKAA